MFKDGEGEEFLCLIPDIETVTSNLTKKMTTYKKQCTSWKLTLIKYISCPYTHSTTANALRLWREMQELKFSSRLWVPQSLGDRANEQKLTLV